MTQPGETDGLDVNGHLRAIESQLATIGAATAIRFGPWPKTHYPTDPRWITTDPKGAEPVECDLDGLHEQGYRVMLASMQGPQQRSQGHQLQRHPAA